MSKCVLCISVCIFAINQVTNSAFFAVNSASIIHRAGISAYIKYLIKLVLLATRSNAGSKPSKNPSIQLDVIRKTNVSYLLSWVWKGGHFLFCILNHPWFHVHQHSQLRFIPFFGRWHNKAAVECARNHLLENEARFQSFTVKKWKWTGSRKSCTLGLK